MRRAVVLGDSLSFHGPEGPLPLSDRRLYPNVLADRLTEATGEVWAVDVWARAGWGLRELWLGLQKDVHLQQQLLMHADAVVLGMGNADQLSIGVPRWVVMSLPYLRPKRLRRLLRQRLDHVHPSLVRMTGGRMQFTPKDVIQHTFGKSVAAVRLFAGEDVPLVTLLPPDHNDAPYYAGAHNHHAATHALMTRLAAEHGLAAVDGAAITRPRLAELNIDGIHWSFAVHDLVGTAMADALLPQVRGTASVPDRRS